MPSISKAIIASQVAPRMTPFRSTRRFSLRSLPEKRMSRIANAARKRTARMLKGLMELMAILEKTNEVLLATMTAAISASDWRTLSPAARFLLVSIRIAFPPA